MRFQTTLAFLSLAAAAHAAALTFSPIADVFVSAANPSSNYGGAGALSVTASGLAKGEFDSLLKFDLSTMPTSFDSTLGAGQWAIQSITLKLTSATPNNAIFNSSAAGQFAIKWMQNDSWQPGDGTPQPTPDTTGVRITFSTFSSFLSGTDEALGTFSFNGATSGNNTWTLMLKPSFLADVTAGNQMSLLMSAADTAVAYMSNSQDNMNAANRPVLTVTASTVPEPFSGVLLVGGAFVLLARRCHARGR